MFKFLSKLFTNTKSLAGVSGVRDAGDVRGKHIFTEEHIDLLMIRIKEKLEKIEKSLERLEEERKELGIAVRELYKQNLKLVEKYEGK